jgi:tetratricopeptide (TPR) repeat protein
MRCNAPVLAVAGFSMLAACLAVPHCAHAEGALAIGWTGNIAKDGITYGYGTNFATRQDAIDGAMRDCRLARNAPKLGPLCKPVTSFAEQCVVIAWDPKEGVPGFGWDTNADLGTAVEKALNKCRATATPNRRSFCVLDNASCDFNDVDKRISAYSQIVQLALAPSRLARAYRLRGNAYEQKKDYDHAITDFGEVIRLDPQDASGWNSRCWARAIANRDLQQALADCNESLRLRPDDSNTMDSRGFAYLRLGQLDSAIADYDAALRIGPTRAASLYGRGLAKRRKGDVAGGEADVAAAQAIDTGISERFAGYGVLPAAVTTPSTATAAPSAGCAGAETHWKSAEEIKTLAVYEDHLARFPNCSFATLARARIEALKK